MKIPGLGEVTKDNELGWYRSGPISIRLLGGKICYVSVEGYDEDSNKSDFHAAIANLLLSPPSLLKSAEEYVYRYYLDMNSTWSPSDDEYVSLPHRPMCGIMFT